MSVNITLPADLFTDRNGNSIELGVGADVDAATGAIAILGSATFSGSIGINAATTEENEFKVGLTKARLGTNFDYDDTTKIVTIGAGVANSVFIKASDTTIKGDVALYGTNPGVGPNGNGGNAAFCAGGGIGTGWCGWTWLFPGESGADADGGESNYLEGGKSGRNYTGGTLGGNYIHGGYLNSGTGSAHGGSNYIFGTNGQGSGNMDGGNVILSGGWNLNAGVPGTIQFFQGYNYGGGTSLGTFGLNVDTPELKIGFGTALGGLRLAGNNSGFRDGAFVGAEDAQSANTAGSDLELAAGNGLGTGSSGLVCIYAGVSGATSLSGGNVEIYGGDTIGQSGGKGGNVELYAGVSSSGTVNGGDIIISAADGKGSKSDADGGNVFFTAGVGAGAGADGAFIFLSGTAAQTEIFRIDGGGFSFPGAGTNSLKIGVGALADGDESCAYGDDARTHTLGSIAIGYNCFTGFTGDKKIAIGRDIDIGDNETHFNLILIGDGATVLDSGFAKWDSIGIGHNVRISDRNQLVFGDDGIIRDLWMGGTNNLTGVDSADFLWRFAPNGGAVSDTKGGDFTIRGKSGTGNAEGAATIFEVGIPTTAGTTNQIAEERFRVDANGFGRDTPFHSWRQNIILETVTLDTGATFTDTTIQLPAGAIIEAVAYNISTTITGPPTTLDLGDSVTTDRFLTGGSVAGFAKETGLRIWDPSVATTAATGPTQAAAAAVRITLDAIPTTGAVQITIAYRTIL